MNRWLWPLTGVFVLASAYAKWQHLPELVLFLLSCAAIIPLAGLMGRSTESIAARVGPRIGGLLSATFGNAVELIIGIFALKSGYITLVKASITGSILGNLLFVLGLSFFVGGIRHPVQRFNTSAARSNAGMLLLGVGVAYIVPAIFAGSAPGQSLALSGTTAVILFLVYGAGLFFSLFTHADLFQYITTEEAKEGHWRFRSAVIVLCVATVLVGVESDWLVDGVRAVGQNLGWSEMFIGVIVVAVIGNAAEHASAVWMAWKDRMDLSLEIAVGSSLQVAMFVAPVLFFASCLMGHAMPLLFSWPELASMGAAVLLVIILMIDGESNWLEGAMAVGAYIVMAVGFYTLRG
ncbi:calcium/proton exchanger [Alicyclobacillus cycloheptanicus]|uniref:Ca(2+)/H(+) antiporter n=1 Tax=Alicyclobacillus cycloheptanicus TaxID=1457 RepID=A0ABT9XD60_9BACL|nr:calcium/proton exchanger [Alicyclobacillus cycloheptanicus]MDQ0188228.1 Ca2+:H+ antiporter [Alicyclobacillus cycloheptanicus]WDM00956.1 calcium/proton exchanger [Alicyclobacillus cycloheptanicus]